MIGTTIGTPLSETTGGLRLRSRLSTYTAAPSSTASAPTRSSDQAAAGR